ncbi:MAG: HD-GYP domain-containing protein [Firmicutes bacterium]|nr:HD-GYP domain-containing protein [Bacillota bacterium]
MIVSMINMLEIHDSYTKNHSKNVADLSAKIAEKMGLSKERVDKAYWAGIIHDIGKTLIPYEILNNKEKLTDEEYNIIKKHPVYGYETLRDSKELRNVARYVKHHHERWDGIGYPDGLKKEEIPLISQILTVADTWDAMTSNRSYRKALSKEIAVEEIKKNKGTQFSPRVVDVFLNKLDIV